MQAKKDAWMAMPDEDKAAYKEEKEQIREANAATALACGCSCKENGLSDFTELVKGKEGVVAKTLGFRPPREDGDGLWSSHHSKPHDQDDIESMCTAFTTEDKCADLSATICEDEGVDSTTATVKRGRHGKYNHHGKYNSEPAALSETELYCRCCKDP